MDATSLLVAVLLSYLFLRTLLLFFVFIFHVTTLSRRGDMTETEGHNSWTNFLGRARAFFPALALPDWNGTLHPVRSADPTLPHARVVPVLGRGFDFSSARARPTWNDTLHSRPLVPGVARALPDGNDTLVLPHAGQVGLVDNCLRSIVERALTEPSSPVEALLADAWLQLYAERMLAEHRRFLRNLLVDQSGCAEEDVDRALKEMGDMEGRKILDLYMRERVVEEEKEIGGEEDQLKLEEASEEEFLKKLEGEGPETTREEDLLKQQEDKEEEEEKERGGGEEELLKQQEDREEEEKEIGGEEDQLKQAMEVKVFLKKLEGEGPETMREGRLRICYHCWRPICGMGRKKIGLWKKMKWWLRCKAPPVECRCNVKTLYPRVDVAP